MDKLEKIKSSLFSQPVLAGKDNYVIKIASTKEETDAVYKLRYDVFTVEQGRNIAAYAAATDHDRFDDCCLHLIVLKVDENKIVGTYRIHFGIVAESSGLGFYSETEYRIQGLDSLAPQMIEVGRSCVAPEGRNGTVVALLWKGMAEILRRGGMRYLAGCVSLEDTSPVSGWGLYEYFRTTGKTSDLVHAEPLPRYVMKRPAESEILAFADDFKRVMAALPPLFKGYLRLKAKICGEPVYDPDFGTIDFFIILDTWSLDERYNRHFDVAVPGETT